MKTGCFEQVANRMSESKSNWEPSPVEHLVNKAVLGDAAFGLWHDMTRPVFDLGHYGPPKEYRIESEWFVVDGLTFTRVDFAASTYRRNHRHIRSGDPDYFHLHMPLLGFERGQVHRHPVVAGPDRITLQDWSWPYYTVAEPTEKFGLLIPRERLERRDWIREHSPVISWPRNSMAGSALAYAWRKLWAMLVSGETDTILQWTSRFVELVNSLVDRQWRQAAPSQSTADLLSAMLDFLDDRLDQQPLGPLDLVAAFSCSRATVHRLFTGFGGVRTYVQNQRLAECFDALTQEDPSERYVYQIAERWGFTSAAHFSRAFRKRYGLGAQELNNSALNSFSVANCLPGECREIEQVHHWLTR
jgi:AraC-like DNA-binding protein